MRLRLWSVWLVAMLAVGGAGAVTFIATDVPVRIPDGPSGIAESEMTVSDTRTIVDLNVYVTIRHSWDGDLRLYLEAPGGAVVRLADRCGHEGDDYDSTCFDDEAAVDICDGDPPFSGCWIPDMRLWELDDLAANGVWILRVTDNASGDTGSVIAWSLDFELSTAAESGPPEIAHELAFHDAYPNPFNARTEFRFALPRDSRAQLVIFDLLGRQAATIFDQQLAGGEHRVPFDAHNLSGGVYFAQLRSAGAALTQKIVLLK